MDCCLPMDPTGNAVDFSAVLLLGLTISFGHCLGMCGPLVSNFALRQGTGRSRAALAVRALVYHLARILSYSILGAMVGAVGSTVSLLGTGRTAQGTFSLVVAASLFWVAAQHLGWLPPAERWLGRGWGRRVGCAMAGLMEAPGLRHCAALGFVNGWLPCGPVYAAAVTAAATASVAKGALTMALFGLGTLPVLWAFALGAAQLGRAARQALHVISSTFLLLIAVQLTLRGLAAWGVVGHLRFGEVVIW